MKRAVKSRLHAHAPMAKAIYAKESRQILQEPKYFKEYPSLQRPI